MDPASAAVAFVGFAASVLALAGAVAEGSRALHNLWSKLKDAPRDSKRLLVVLGTLEGLVKVIERQDEHSFMHNLPSDLRKVWNELSLQMIEDFGNLKEDTARLEKALLAPSISKKFVRMRLLKFFIDDGIRKYYTHFLEHVQTLQVILSYSNISVSHAISCHTRGSATVIDKIHKSVTELNHNQQINHQYLAINLLASSTHQQQILSLNRRVGMLESGLFFQDIKNASTDDSLPPPYENRPSLHHVDTAVVIPKLVGWQWGVYRTPIGTLTIGAAKRRSEGEPGDENVPEADVSAYREIQMTYALPSWISNDVITVSRDVQYSLYGGPGFKWTFRQACYNSDPDLMMAINYPNIPKLKKMFSKGLAGPNDLLAPWGRSLLHQAVITHILGGDGAVELCQFLLMAGADPNVRSLDGKTPLILCCTLMLNPFRGTILQPLATKLLAAGADIAAVDSDGNSSCALIFNSPSGREYLESSVWKHVDLATFQGLPESDFWLLSAIARSVPEFKLKLEKQLEEFYTPPKINSQPNRKLPSLLEIDISNQVLEIQQSDKRLRISFMRTICRQGSASMLEPLIEAGLKINDAENEERMTYLGEATDSGNYETCVVLLNAGAQISGEWSPIDTLVERWGSSNADLQIKEASILEKLLDNPDIEAPNALARCVRYNLELCTESLLKRGLMWKPAGSPIGMRSFLGCEAMEAVKNESLQSLKLLIRYGAMIQAEDRGGCTPLLQALDKGMVEYVRCLIAGGASPVLPTSRGYTAYQLAAANAKARHPRRPVLVGAFGFNDNRPSVDEETDLEMYAVLQEAINCHSLLTGDTIGLPQKSLSLVVSQFYQNAYNEYLRFWKEVSNIRLKEVVLSNIGIAGMFIFFVLYKTMKTAWWGFDSHKGVGATVFLVLVGYFLWD